MRSVSVTVTYIVLSNSDVILRSEGEEGQLRAKNLRPSLKYAPSLFDVKIKLR